MDKSGRFTQRAKAEVVGAVGGLLEPDAAGLGLAHDGLPGLASG
jgi:hypothetical protein